MTTASQIITRAYKMAGVLAAGETASADLANDGLVYLNGVLDKLSNENLAIYSDDLDSVAMDGSTSYTYGLTGDINAARPQSINYAFFRDTNNIDYPLALITSAEYLSLYSKTVATGVPGYVYMESTYPLATVYAWPLSSTGTLFLNARKPLANLATLQTSLSMPKGYDRLLIEQLAVEIMPEYGIANQQLVAMANKTKADIKRTNSRSTVLSVNLPFGQGAKGGGWPSILTDGLV